jgi:aminoglycoside phosphotransferase (APT) family kinase protein
VAAWSLGDDFIPKVIAVGWEVFEATVPRALADAVFAVHADADALADELLATGRTLIHGDLRWANLGFDGDRVVLLDWGVAATAPPALDFTWFLFVNGRRVDATYDELLDDFRALEGEPPRAAWLAQLAMHGGLLAHELIESDDAKREVARRELAWWCGRAGEAV